MLAQLNVFPKVHRHLGRIRRQPRKQQQRQDKTSITHDRHPQLKSPYLIQV